MPIRPRGLGPNGLPDLEQSADTVSFIDINPNSSTFHQVVKNRLGGKGPAAWTRNEDLIVCNQIDDTISIIGVLLEVPDVRQLNEPFEVCVFPRQAAAFLNVYFEDILNRSGTVAIFESGPNGVNGWASTT